MDLKRCLVAAVICSSLTLSAQGQKTDTLSLSLDECIKIALSDNPTIKVADMEIQRVDYSKKETLGQLLPALAFGGNYNRTLAKQVAYFNMSAMGGGKADTGTTPETPSKDAGIKMGLDNTFALGFNASMPLIAPQLWKSLKLSDSQILQNIEMARSSRISLVNQVQNAYYSLLLSYDSYFVIKQNYETSVYNAKIFKGKFDLGTASEYEVLRSSVQVKNIEPQMLQAEIAIKQSLLQLKILMGMNASINIKPNTSLSAYENSMFDSTLSINKSLIDNTDLKSLDLQTDYMKRALDVKRMAWYPTLSLSASYNWNSSSDGSPFKNFRWTPYSVVGLTLSFPLYQGGQRYNRIKQAEISVKEMSYQRENLERTLNMQVELQIDNIKKNVKQISTNSEGVKQAEKAFEIMQKSFKIGAATYLDLRDSELALITSKLTYYQSIYNYLVATSDLQLLLGNADLNKYKSLENK
ncbi:MAG: TolC family protein [Muribaculaceae bacterium]